MYAKLNVLSFKIYQKIWPWEKFMWQSVENILTERTAQKMLKIFLFLHVKQIKEFSNITS